MAEYFGTKDEAEKFIKEWFGKDGKPPVHFAKILNHGNEKWVVNYDARQNPAASPHITILEDHSRRDGCARWWQQQHCDARARWHRDAQSRHIPGSGA